MFQAKEKLALQSIEHIFDAAEPIVVSTVKQFVETFAPYGLRRDAMTGGYGLAESCVYVCDGGHQALSVRREKLEKEGKVEVLSVWKELTNGLAWSAPSSVETSVLQDSVPTKKSDVVELFSCGDVKKNPEVLIRIVKDNEALEEDLVGEIFLSSPSLAAGYYPSSTEAFSVSEGERSHFQHTIHGDESRRYLATGDLGFIHVRSVFSWFRRTASCSSAVERRT